MTTTGTRAHERHPRWHLRSTGQPADISTTRRSETYVLVRATAINAEQVIVEKLRPLSLPGMRVLLGVVFVWFGGLKVAGRSPVADLVAGTLPWAPRHLVLPVLGTLEVTLGLALLAGVALRIVLPVLVAHLAGTFMTFAMLPALMFRHHDPLLLTADGEFVAKNIVLISAAIVLITHAGGTRQLEPAGSASRTDAGG